MASLAKDLCFFESFKLELFFTLKFIITGKAFLQSHLMKREKKPVIVFLYQAQLPGLKCTTSTKVRRSGQKTKQKNNDNSRSKALTLLFDS